MTREILNGYLILREEPGWETKMSLQDAFNHNLLTPNEIEDWLKPPREVPESEYPALGVFGNYTETGQI